MESENFLIFPTLMTWYYFKDIKMIKSANLQWKTWGEELFYHILKSATFKCLALLLLGSFFVWMNVLRFGLLTKDDSTIENEVLKLIDCLI